MLRTSHEPSRSTSERPRKGCGRMVKTQALDTANTGWCFCRTAELTGFF